MNSACLRLLDEKMCELSLVIQGCKGELFARSKPSHFHELVDQRCQLKGLPLLAFGLKSLTLEVELFGHGGS
jgi:hypothetical protein